MATCQLGDVCKINPPKISTRNLSDDLEVSFVPMAAICEVHGEITTPKKKLLHEVKSGFTNFVEGDVIFAKITPCMENDKVAIVNKLINCIDYDSTEFFVLRCGEQLLNTFVHHLVNLLDREQWTKELAEKVLERIEQIKKSILSSAFHGKISKNF